MLCALPLRTAPKLPCTRPRTTGHNFNPSLGRRLLTPRGSALHHRVPKIPSLIPAEPCCLVPPGVERLGPSRPAAARGRHRAGGCGLRPRVMEPRPGRSRRVGKCSRKEGKLCYPKQLSKEALLLGRGRRCSLKFAQADSRGH